MKGNEKVSIYEGFKVIKSYQLRRRPQFLKMLRCPEFKKETAKASKTNKIS